MDESLTLDEASRRLGVSARRARAMVAAGTLPAEKRGRQWFIPAAAVRQADHTRDRRPRRPLTPRSAWARAAALAAGDGADRAAAGSLDELRRLVRPRAKHLACYVHPGVLAELRRRRDIVLGGRDAAAQADVPVDPSDVDLYVRESDVEHVLEAVAARVVLDGANVFAHVVPDDAWPFQPGQRHADAWVAWLDLEDRQDRAADTLLDRLVGGRARGATRRRSGTGSASTAGRR